MALCIQSAGVFVRTLVDIRASSVEGVSCVAWQALAGVRPHQVSTDGSLPTAPAELALVDVQALLVGVAREPRAA